MQPPHAPKSDSPRLRQHPEFQPPPTSTGGRGNAAWGHLPADNGPAEARGASLMAGAAKVDITNRDAGPVNDPLYARALVIRSGETTAVLVAVDAVAIGEIGYITNEYLPTVRATLNDELGIRPEHVLINASHCHGIVCDDVAERTVQAVKAAVEKMVPVTVGAGSGHEDRIMENRRLKLKSGREVDVRHAYSLPPDDAVAEVGPVDPQIGLLRLDREDGTPLAVVYNFACHPIQGSRAERTLPTSPASRRRSSKRTWGGCHRPVSAGVRRRHQSD